MNRHLSVDTSAPHPNGPARVDEASEAPEYLMRRDVQRHLGISERGGDRFIRTHGLQCGSGRQVLVRLDSYAACLFGLRQRSTRDDSPVPSRSTDYTWLPPIEFQPGLDVCMVMCFEPRAGSPPDRRMHFLLKERGKAPPSTPDELRQMTVSTDDYVRDKWAYALLVRILEAVGVRLALGRSGSGPCGAERPDAVRHARTCLEWYHSTQGRLTGAGLKRLLRRAHGAQRDALLEALAQGINHAPGDRACTPHGYALRPLLDEAALSRRIHREPPTLKRWRVEGKGPVFIRVGKLIRYSAIDVQAWLGEDAHW